MNGNSPLVASASLLATTMFGETSGHKTDMECGKEEKLTRMSIETKLKHNWAEASGKPVRYRVAAFDFETKDAAKKAAAAAHAAAEKAQLPSDNEPPKDEVIAKTRLVEIRITTAVEALMKASQAK